MDTKCENLPMGAFDLDCDPIKCFLNPKLIQNFKTMSQGPEDNKN